MLGKPLTSLSVVLILAFGPALVHAEQTPAMTPSKVVNGMLARVAALVEPAPGQGAKTFTATIRVTKADGLPKEVTGATAEIALQAPDHLGLVAHVKGETYAVCRDGQELWAHEPDKNFGVVGKPGVPLFTADPSSIDRTVMGPLKLPINLNQLQWPLMLTSMEAGADETIDGAKCWVVKIAAPAAATSMLKLPPARVEVAVRQADSFPARVRYEDGKVAVEVMIDKPALIEAWPAENWKIHARPGDKIETTAVSHLVKFIDVACNAMNNNIPTLGPVTGERRLVGVSGNGRLEIHDGTRVLFMKGTPEEMGKQQGELLKNEIHDVMTRIVYGIGVGSSFPKGRWFFGEIEEAEKRLHPFISDRTYREIDAMADAAGVHRLEARLANFFPELFHCSGFSLTGDATVGGHMFHGRILDYMKGVGLEQNAVVMVYQPEVGNAWVNLSYAGFVGSVTAMNAKHISMGEMGGRGEGNWDGKPMAQLIREVMEKSSTLDEAIAIMRKGPRTCSYYYVISDGNSKQAVGIAATPDTFELVHLGEAHPLLPDAVKDCVLLSAGDRYKTLVARVKEGYGKFTADSARELMTRPVAMNSCIQAVLFEPDTLDFWVANADRKNVASHTRYTHYNLDELLKSAPAK
jgi:isopenicillin-N N-acyltransferase-like protein